MVSDMNQFDLYIPTHLLFGAGVLDLLHEQKLPGKKALIIISNGKSTRANGYLARTEEQLKLAGVETMVYDKIQANPTKNNVMEGAAAAKKFGAEFLVALGGGSVVDASKAIAIMSTNPGDLWDYVKTGTGGKKPIEVEPLPLVAIGTTAGTGSEMDSGCVITNEDTHEKTGTGYANGFPVLSVEDIDLMTSVPPMFTAFQGFDAMTHSLEGYITKVASLMSDMYALTAIENVSHYLPRAIKDGNDIEARKHVAFGSLLSGMLMCVGSTSSQHSLEHAMSAYHPNLPHGAGLIILSRSYFKHFIDIHACDDRFIKMAKAMGKEDAADPYDFIEVLDKFLHDCNVGDLKMSDYGITPDEFDKMADNAMGPMGFKFDKDRIRMTKQEIIDIYMDAYK